MQNGPPTIRMRRKRRSRCWHGVHRTADQQELDAGEIETIYMEQIAD